MVKDAEYYKAVYDENDSEGVYAISLVDSPANEINWIAMSKEPIKFRSDEKKKILYGVVLRPDQQIYREHSDGSPYYISFDAETIEKLSQNYFRKGYQNNSNYNHLQSAKLKGVTAVESWIVSDPDKDKLTAIGFSDVKQGDWAIGMKVSDEVWDEYITSGKTKGFSIEAFVPLENIKMQTNKINKQMKQEGNLLKRLLKFLTEIKMASFTSDMGELTADALEVGAIVYDAEGNPLMDATFTVENKIYMTDETGMIKEIADAPATEDVKQEDVPPSEDKDLEDEENKQGAQENAQEIADELNKPAEEVDVEALKEKIAELQAEIEKITKAKEEVLMENTKLKALEASIKIKASAQAPVKTDLKGKAAIVDLLIKNKNK